MSKIRNVPDPYDPIFLRRGKGDGGYAGIKSAPWNSMRRGRDTTLFEDFIFALNEVREVVKFFQTSLPDHSNFSPAAWSVHPILNPDEANAIIDNLSSEVQYLPTYWRKYTLDQYRLSDLITREYTRKQLSWRPDMTPERAKAEWMPFMTKSERMAYEEYAYLELIALRREAGVMGLVDEDDEIELADVPEE
jgi:hypothetical protein